MVTSCVLSREERESLVVVFEQIADATHVGPGLQRFSRAVAAQLIAAGLDEQADEQAGHNRRQPAVLPAHAGGAGSGTPVRAEHR